MVVIAADFHIGLRSHRLIDGIDSRLVDIKDRLRFLGAKIVKNKVKTFIIAGDVFERTHPTPYEYYLVISFLKQLHSKGVDIYIIPGNHDMSITTNSLLPLKKVTGVTVCDGTDGTFARIEGKDFLFVPGNLKKLPNVGYKCDYLICHANDIPLYKGMEGIMDFPIKNVAYNLAISGHIHKHYFNEHYKVVYTGSLTPRNYGEVENKNGFLVLKPAEKSYLFMPLHQGMSYGVVNITSGMDVKKTLAKIGLYDEVKLIFEFDEINDIMKVLDTIKEKTTTYVARWEIAVEDTTQTKKIKRYSNYFNYAESYTKWCNVNKEKVEGTDARNVGLEVINYVLDAEEKKRKAL